MNIPRLILCILCAIFFQSALADQVTPNDRVETRLRVRHDPAGSSSVVGYLNLGETARLEESVRYWYRVTLSDGTPGYVSKAWSRVIVDQGGSPDSIRLGEWNIMKLGYDNGKNFPLVAQIIDTHFDIVAVVEVMQVAHGHPGYDHLLSDLGSGWAGMVTATPRPNKPSASWAEFYAVLYRTQRIQPCAGWTGLRYLDDNDGSGSQTTEDVFSREPAFGCFAVRLADGSTGFDFMLAAYHARFSGGITKIKNEVKHVTAAFQAMGQARPGENDRILVGDFNLDTPRLEQVLGPQVQTVGTGSTLHDDGSLTANVYDHLLLFDRAATGEMLSDPQVLDVRDLAATPAVYFWTVSDHLPIEARFRAGPDDD